MYFSLLSTPKIPGNDMQTKHMKTFKGGEKNSEQLVTLEPEENLDD